MQRFRTPIIHFMTPHDRGTGVSRQNNKQGPKCTHSITEQVSEAIPAAHTGKSRCIRRATPPPHSTIQTHTTIPNTRTETGQNTACTAWFKKNFGPGFWVDRLIQVGGGGRAFHPLAYHPFPWCTVTALLRKAGFSLFFLPRLIIPLHLVACYTT